MAKIRVIGGGWYGSHICLSLLEDGHDVEIHEISDHLFAGASGGNPARLHQGFHYPRSRLTRAACQDHQAEFIGAYGDLTRHVPVNIYAIAEHDSMVDFGTYQQVLRGEVEFIVVKPEDFGLQHAEGAMLTGERHIVIDQARDFFESRLSHVVQYGRRPDRIDDPAWDWTIDATFAANDAENIERYEPCVVGLLEGPVNKAVTIMDGPFSSLYVWNERLALSSLSSASLTPFSKTCRTYAEAKAVLDRIKPIDAEQRVNAMFEQMEYFYPDILEYDVVGHLLSIRAMPRSGADARLVDVVRVGERALRVRAGKIDAIFHAARIVKDMIDGPRTVRRETAA